jgi:outer membrane usher protein FimD/PapC
MATYSPSRLTATLLACAVLTVAAPAFAAEGSVVIQSPANGQKLDIMEQNRLQYQVTPGPGGDHVHVYVNDKEVGILRQLQGSYTFESLPEGDNTICVKVVNKAHVPIGVQQCVKVTVG